MSSYVVKTREIMNKSNNNNALVHNNAESKNQGLHKKGCNASDLYYSNL